MKILSNQLDFWEQVYEDSSMEGFLSSFRPLLEKYKTEALLLGISFLIALTNIALLFTHFTKEKPVILVQEKTQGSKQEYVLIEISGSVEKPDVYRVKKGTRLKDILIAAGGLSDNADRLYFSRNFNLSSILKDEQKIYIPSVEESSGTSTQKVLGETFPQSSIIHLNSASIDELDQLPGIGKVSAQKIIDNRPYSFADELVSRKIIYKSAFEKIKERVAP